MAFNLTQTSESSPFSLEALAQSLLAWFSENHRSLPWRVLSPGRPDPYRVWLSETLLQQTTVATVLPYFERFLERFPTLEAAASADEETLLALWSGLGYYSRARRFRQAAQILWEARDTLWPTDIAEWQRLPGVGPYTAAAVCAMAFNVPVVPVDGNVRRILRRLWGQPEASDAQVSAWASSWPQHCQLPWGDFAQALMDLGALICRPRQPQCQACPWRKECRLAEATSLLKPARSQTAPRARRKSFALCLLREHGGVYLEKGTQNLFKGLLTVPFVDISPEGPAPAPSFRHVLSHFDWWVTVVTLPIREGQTVLSREDVSPETLALLTPHTSDFFPYKLEGGNWFRADQLEHAPVSTLLRRILKECHFLGERPTTEQRTV